MTNTQQELRSFLYKLFESGDDAGFPEFIRKNPEIIGAEYGEYPDFHRIGDISVGEHKYRVCRQFSSGEKITLFLIEEVMEAPGVPLWLDGERLKKWVKSEEDDPSDEPIDWDSLR